MTARRKKSTDRNATPFTVIETITLRLDDGRTFEVRPSILQQHDAHWMGFAEGDVEPLTHRFDVIVAREHFEIQHDSYSEERADALWADLRQAYVIPEAAREAHLTRYGPRGFPLREDEHMLWLAYLIVSELPTHIVAPDEDWYPVLDSIGDTMHDAFLIVEELQEFTMALATGSLIWPRLLGVHPRMRGQEIGLRLLAHGLWAMHRSTGDIAIIEAAAIPTCWEVKVPRQTLRSAKALCAYYARLGFKRWYTKAKLNQRSGTVMVLALGEDGIEAFLPSGEKLAA